MKPDYRYVEMALDGTYTILDKSGKPYLHKGHEVRVTSIWVRCMVYPETGLFVDGWSPEERLAKILCTRLRKCEGL